MNEVMEQPNKSTLDPGIVRDVNVGKRHHGQGPVGLRRSASLDAGSVFRWKSVQNVNSV